MKNINFCSWSLLIFNILTLGTSQIVMEIFIFCSTSQLIFNILLFMKFIQIENIIKKAYICKYGNHWNTTGFSMILMILGAQKSPPNTYFFVMCFFKITYCPKLKTFDLPIVLQAIHLPNWQKPHSEKQLKNKQNPNAPSRHWKSPRLQNVDICNVFAS